MNDLNSWMLTEEGLNVNACYRPDFESDANGNLVISVPSGVHKGQVPQLVKLLRDSGLVKSVKQ